MATTARYIRSDYTIEDRDRLEIETGQIESPSDDDSLLDRDTLLKTIELSKRVLNPPRFVPATFTSDYWEPTNTTATSSRTFQESDEKESIGNWYASLKRTSESTSGTPGTASPAPKRILNDSTLQKKTSAEKSVERTKNDWFITRALVAVEIAKRQTETEGGNGGDDEGCATANETTRNCSVSVAPPPTLADILARDPPPLPTQEPFTPPVWLAIGPGNKGFDMLERSGWEEGQALGKASRNRAGLGYRAENGRDGDDYGEVGELIKVKKEVIDLSILDDDIVDLTVEDDELETDENQLVPIEASSTMSIFKKAMGTVQDSSSTDIDHAPKALLTPLPTVLKSDRLGIGLKAKTVGTGIYREPVRRVTHGQAALAAHIRANEKLQQMKKVVGRGRRGFERMKKRESEKRKDLLAYLNTD